MAGANDRKQYKSWDEEIAGTHLERTFREIKKITSKFELPKTTAVFDVEEGSGQIPERFRQMRNKPALEEDIE